MDKRKGCIPYYGPHVPAINILCNLCRRLTKTDCRQLCKETVGNEESNMHHFSFKIGALRYKYSGEITKCKK